MVIMEIWKNIHPTVSWDRGMGGVNYKRLLFSTVLYITSMHYYCNQENFKLF